MTTATRGTTPPRSPVDVHELKRAWLAVQAGQFREQPGEAAPRAAGDSPTRGSTSGGQVWQPDEPVLPVVGCTGSVGASTIALALATAASSPDSNTDSEVGYARVVECCTVTASGLASATTVELGRHSSGWVQGTRDHVLLERAGGLVLGPGAVPIPSANSLHPVSLTVLDVGWELGLLVASPGWLTDEVLRAPHVVAVTTATTPGMRRLEGALALLGGVSVVAAILGPAPRNGSRNRQRDWPREVEHSVGALTRRLDQDGRVHQIPLDRRLARRGLDSAALPAPLLVAADRLLRAATQAAHPSASTKGRPE